jgi:hypothetical protein
VEEAWTILSDDAAATSGSIVVDIWKDVYANFPPTVGDKITASAPPTISTATKSTDATLTGWTTAVTANDVFGINLNTVATAKFVELFVGNGTLSSSDIAFLLPIF